MVFSYIVSFLQNTFDIIHYIILLSYHIGQIIVNILSYILDGLLSILTQIFTFCQLFNEELFYFADDAYRYTGEFFTAIIQTVTNNCNTITHLVGAAAENIKSGNEKALNIGTSVTTTFHWIFVSGKNGLILLGNAVWFLVTLLPNLLWYTLHYTDQLIYYVYRTIPVILYSYIKALPFEACCGMVSLFLIYKKFHLVRIFGRFLFIKIWDISTLIYVYLFYYLRVFCVSLINQVKLMMRRQTRRVINRRSMLNCPTTNLIQCTPADTTETYNSKRDCYYCVVCQHRDKCVVIFPCRHLCLCGECSKMMDTLDRNQSRCPICRVQVNQKISVFI